MDDIPKTASLPCSKSTTSTTSVVLSTELVALTCVLLRQTTPLSALRANAIENKVNFQDKIFMARKTVLQSSSLTQIRWLWWNKQLLIPS